MTPQNNDIPSLILQKPLKTRNTDERLALLSQNLFLESKLCEEGNLFIVQSSLRRINESILRKYLLSQFLKWIFVMCHQWCQWLVMNSEAVCSRYAWALINNILDNFPYIATCVDPFKGSWTRSKWSYFLICVLTCMEHELLLTRKEMKEAS